MIVNASRGQDFVEPFNFKHADGRVMALPQGSFSLTLERGGFQKEFPALPRRGQTLLWQMTADETDGLKYDSYFFTLFWNEQQVSRGILRVG